MKIRNGFVSNSSSSSFILGTTTKLEDITVKIEIPLCDAVDKIITASSIAELAAWLRKNYGMTKPKIANAKEDEQVLNDFGINVKSITEIFERGETVIYCKVSSDNGGISRFICDCYKPELEFAHAKLVWDSGSY